VNERAAAYPDGKIPPVSGTTGIETSSSAFILSGKTGNVVACRIMEIIIEETKLSVYTPGREGCRDG